MATLKQIKDTYDWMTKGFLLALGIHADITCAHYDGDYTKSLVQAQLDKKEWIAEKLGYSKGKTFLDIGSGWGNILSFIKSKGGKGIGFTLSPGQQAHCVANNLDARIQDYKTTLPLKVNGITAIGSPEHYCSPEEFLDGKQEQIYSDFFKFCHESLKESGMLYFHTMIWGKKGVPDYHKIMEIGKKYPSYKSALATESEELLDMWHLYVLISFYPGSWLPASLEQIKKCAEPYFDFVENKNGRVDYIQTMTEWGSAFRRELKIKNMTFEKIKFILKTCIPMLWNTERKKQLQAFWFKSNQYCFEKNVMSHERIFFRKKK